MPVRVAQVVAMVLLSAVFAGSMAKGTPAGSTGGRICKFTNPGVLTDLGIDFITFRSCAKVSAFAKSIGMHAVPRTTLYGTPRCAFKTAATSEVGAGVIVFKTRAAKSLSNPCKLAGHWNGFTRVSILYAAAAAAAANH